MELLPGGTAWAIPTVLFISTRTARFSAHLPDPDLYMLILLAARKPGQRRYRRNYIPEEELGYSDGAARFQRYCAHLRLSQWGHSCTNFNPNVTHSKVWHVVQTLFFGRVPQEPLKADVTARFAVQFLQGYIHSYHSPSCPPAVVPANDASQSPALSGAGADSFDARPEAGAALNDEFFPIASSTPQAPPEEFHGSR